MAFFDVHQGWIWRAHRWFLYVGAVYMGFVILLTVPVFQRNAIYLHNIRFPLRANFSHPESFGLALHKTRNFKLATPDGEQLGAWHVLPTSIFQSEPVFPRPTPFDDAVFDAALEARPTVLFFHGNAASRALSNRVQLASSVTNILDVNFVIIDYRGFGDSTGTPSEEGLAIDARAAWEWVMAHNGGRPNEVAIVGQSLGTGVSSRLVADLANEGVSPAVVALFSPYASIAELLKTYNLFRFLPILQPFHAIPHAQMFLSSPKVLKHQFNSVERLMSLPKSCSTNILIAHAKDDVEIPSSHSRKLYRQLLNKQLGVDALPLAPQGMHLEALENYRTSLEERGRLESAISTTTTFPDWGVVQTFLRGDAGGQVVWLEARRGGHDEFGGSEGVIALLGEVWGLRGRHA